MVVAERAPTPIHAPAQAGGLRLRDYQAAALGAIADAHAAGETPALVVLPTGTGKTVVFAHLIARRGGRALVLVHRDELVQQAAAKIGQVAPAVAVGVVKAGRDERDAPVVIASVQTLAQPRRLARLAPDFGTLVVDEAHHAAAPTYRRILTHLGAFAPRGPLTVGFTATPDRADGVGLGAVFRSVAYRQDLPEMIAAGYLADLRATQIRLAADFHALHTRAGDVIAGEVAAVLRDANAPAHVVAAYREHAAGRTALLFTPTVDLAHATVAQFTAAGIPAAALDGGTPEAERRAVLAGLRDGRLRVVGNCAVLTEGFDEPSVDCVIVARPTKSRALYAQMIGRGTRPYPGKADCLVLDLVGASARHDLVTAAGLFGLDPDELDGRSVGGALAARREAAEAVAAAGRLVAQTVDLFKSRPAAWVRTPAGGFVLPLGAGWLELAGEGERWTVAERPPLGPPVVLAADLGLGYAQGFAEDYARERGAGALVDRAAPWRRDPASDKQRATLARCRIPHAPTITKGEASDLLAAAFAARGGRR